MSTRGSRMHWWLSVAVMLGTSILLSTGAWAPTGAAAQTIVEVCDSLSHVVADVPSLVVIATDTLVDDHRFERTTPGCQFQMAGLVSAFRDTTSPDALLRRTLTDQGWEEDLRYAADGPDGTAYAFMSSAVRCMIRAAWDGGDITDPSYVPEERYELVIGCIVIPR